jgi:hypothetical protein
MAVKDRYGEPARRGGEWEPIKILLEGDENSNKMNTASYTRLRLTTQVGQAHVATGVPLDLGANTQPSDPRTQQNTKPRVHSPTPVRPVPAGESWRLPLSGSTLVGPVRHTGQTGLSLKVPNRQTGQPISKLTQTRNSSNTGQQQTHPDVHPSKNSPRVAPVRPVKSTGQIGVSWAARDEQHPRVNSPKSKPRSPESVHGLEQDFGDNRNTS